MSITTIGLEELSRKVEDEVNKYAEQVTRSTAMDAWGEVKVATPVIQVLQEILGILAIKIMNTMMKVQEKKILQVILLC